jgi:hypothetical protein
MMKRRNLLSLTAALCFSFAATLPAQIGPNLFKKPNIADIFKPVVGNGAVYQQQRSDRQNEPPSTLEMTIVGSESAEGQDAYWMEIARTGDKASQSGYAKILVTKDFKFHRMIVQQPGQPAMEFPFNPSDNAKNRMNEEIDKWHLVGNESVTVPAGTFSCQHWKKDEGSGDAWVSDKISPISMVKSVSSNDTMTLVKVITDAKDHITGPVTKFDPEALKRQMMQRQQQP